MLDLNIPGTYVLTNTEKREIERVVRSLVPPYRPEDYDAFMRACRLAVNELPLLVHKWKNHVKVQGVGLIRNLPIDDPLRVTPTVRRGADEISMLADSMIGTISSLFGSLYTIWGKTNVRHIHNIYPIEGDELTQNSSNTVELEWHVEDGFHPARPDWVGLLCLRADVEAETKFALARDLHLPPDIVRTLRECRFKMRSDDTFGDEKHAMYVYTSVLAGSTTDPQIVYDPAYTICQDEEDTAALAAVKSAAEEVHRRIVLKEGDFIIFDNRRVIHGRSAYSPRLDGNDRWLKRAFILETSEFTSKLVNGVLNLVSSLK